MCNVHRGSRYCIHSCISIETTMLVISCSSSSNLRRDFIVGIGSECNRKMSSVYYSGVPTEWVKIFYINNLSIHEFASKVLFIFRSTCSSNQRYCDWKRAKITCFDFFKTHSEYMSHISVIWSKKHANLDFFLIFWNPDNPRGTPVPNFLDFKSFSKKANFNVMENNFLIDYFTWHYVRREMKVYTLNENKCQSQAFMNK